ncbi:MAG: hypothetical protein JWN40_2834 [Phycisphaerales bacterium]|nr:hypothetical protein [Phycisphaerales bacterium]
MFQRATMGALLALLCISVSTRAFADATPPQAKPFTDFLQSIKAGDAEQFRDCQSKSTRESNQPWPEKLKQAKSSLAGRYGDYDISKFTYTFAGEESQGDLTVTYPGHDPIKLKVVKEGDNWKLASH